jgi:hypothetical protein
MVSPTYRSPKTFSMLGLALVLMVTGQAEGLADPWMAFLVDTGLSDTGSTGRHGGGRR